MLRSNPSPDNGEPYSMHNGSFVGGILNPVLTKYAHNVPIGLDDLRQGVDGVPRRSRSIYLIAFMYIPAGYGSFKPSLRFIVGFTAHLDAFKERGILVYYSHTHTVLVLFDSSFHWWMLEVVRRNGSLRAWKRLDMSYWTGCDVAIPGTSFLLRPCDQNKISYGHDIFDAREISIKRHG